MSPPNLPIFREALGWRQAGRAVAMACVGRGDHRGALETMQADAPRLLEFGVADETAWRAGLSGQDLCGKDRRDPSGHFGMFADECAARRACVLVTDIDSGEQRLVRSDEAANNPLQDLIEALQPYLPLQPKRQWCGSSREFQQYRAD